MVIISGTVLKAQLPCASCPTPLLTRHAPHSLYVVPPRSDLTQTNWWSIELSFLAVDHLGQSYSKDSPEHHNNNKSIMSVAWLKHVSHKRKMFTVSSIRWPIAYPQNQCPPPRLINTPARPQTTAKTTPRPIISHCRDERLFPLSGHSHEAWIACGGGGVESVVDHAFYLLIFYTATAAGNGTTYTGQPLMFYFGRSYSSTGSSLCIV